MVDVHDDSKIPSQSTQEEIIKKMTNFLHREGKGVDVVRKIENKLKLKKGELKLPHSLTVDHLLWAETLVNVLSDKGHFDIEV